MLFVTLVASLTFVLGQYDCKTGDSWVELPDIPGSTAESVSTIYDNNLYVCGEADTRTFKYDLMENSWSTVANREYQGNHENGFLHENDDNDMEWWLVGGIDANNYGKVQVYTFSSDSWRTEESLPWDGGSVCVSYQKGHIHACGGVIGFDNGQNKGGTNTTNDCAWYDLTSSSPSWKMLNTMPYARNHAATGTDGVNMWIFGGRKGKNVPSDGYNTIQVYFPGNNSWINSDDNSDVLPNPLPVARGGTGHSAYDPDHEEFYVMGGETSDDTTYATSNKVYNRVDIFSQQTLTWRRGANMTVPRHGMFPVYWKNPNTGEAAIYVASGGLHNAYNTSTVFDKYCITTQ